MGLDSILTFLIPIGIFLWIGSQVYQHEKEHLQPMVKTVKSWFEQKEEEPIAIDPEDYKIRFRGPEY